MEPPSIPRMPPVRYGILWAAGGLNIVRLVLQWMFGPVVDWLTMGALTAVYAYVGSRLVWHRWLTRRAVRVLRRLTVNERTAILDELGSEYARAYFEERLAQHGEPEDLGLVERFGFSPVDRRELSILTWTTAGAAVMAMVVPLFASWTGLWRTAAYGCGLLLVAAVWFQLRASEQLSRTFEVSPFGLSEVLPDGSVRKVLWGYGLILRNRPWLGRIELAVADIPDCIKIPYHVVGFDRLVETILAKGGFQQDEAA